MRGKSKVALALITVLILTTGMVFAEGGIGAYFSDIKLYLNGEKIDKEVVVIDGLSYLPVRVIGEALNLNVAWDGKTQTIELKSKEDQMNSSSVDKEMLDIMTENNKQLQADIEVLKELLKRNNIKIPTIDKSDVLIGMGENEFKPMDNGNFDYITPESPCFDSLKNKYTSGITLYSNSAGYYAGATFATQGQFNSFKAIIVKNPGGARWNESGYFKVIADGVEVYESEFLTDEVFAKEIEVDIAGAKIVKLQFNGPSVILGSARFTK